MVRSRRHDVCYIYMMPCRAVRGCQGARFPNFRRPNFSFASRATTSAEWHGETATSQTRDVRRRSVLDREPTSIRVVAIDAARPPVDVQQPEPLRPHLGLQGDHDLAKSPRTSKSRKLRKPTRRVRAVRDEHVAGQAAEGARGGTLAPMHPAQPGLTDQNVDWHDLLHHGNRTGGQVAAQSPVLASPRLPLGLQLRIDLPRKPVSTE